MQALWSKIEKLLEVRDSLRAKENVSEEEGMEYVSLLQETLENYPEEWPEPMQEHYRLFTYSYGFILRTGCIPLAKNKSVLVPKAKDLPKSTCWIRNNDWDENATEMSPTVDEIQSEFDDNATVNRAMLFLMSHGDDTDAFVCLFSMYLQGPDHVRSLAKANQCLEKAAKGGVIEAQILLKLYHWYSDPELSLEYAMDVMLAAHRDGHATQIISHYGAIVGELEGTKRNLVWQKGAVLFHQVLTTVDVDTPWPQDPLHEARASFLWFIGRSICLALRGESVDYDYQEEGLSLLLKAAELRSPQAAEVLSILYTGAYKGTEADLEKLMYWLQKGAEWSDTTRHALTTANWLEEEASGPQDLKMARKLTKRAARLGDEQAQTKLRQCNNQACKNQESRVKDFKRCSKCRVAIYCSVDCQRQHWKNGHKQVCEKTVT